MSLKSIRTELSLLSDTARAVLLQRFFKTGKGEYGEGDVFIGITVPQLRAIAKNFSGVSLSVLHSLLQSKIHEERLVALLVLLQKYQKSRDESIVNFYLQNLDGVNNWDLVDLTAGKILGEHLRNRGRSVLYSLARSNNLWRRRVSIIATSNFIAHNDFRDSLKLSKLFLDDSHDLMHKAVGWMLREVGKRDENVLKSFLKQYYKRMPRTMLRYAIERFDEKTRQAYLKGVV